MTTNIKLFENWLAEEGAAVETPPAVDATAAATTLTTTVKPAAATVTPTKFEAAGDIAKNVSVSATLLSTAKPFDITKSNLTVRISHPGKGTGYSTIRADYKLIGGVPRFSVEAIGGQTNFSKSNYQEIYNLVLNCRNSGGEKRSLSSILYQVLSEAGVTDRTKQDDILKTNSPTGISMYNIMIAAGLTSYRGARGANLTIWRNVVDYLKSLTILAQVNIDTPNQLTGQYAYSFRYKKTGEGEKDSFTSYVDSGTSNSRNVVRVQPTEDPSSLIVNDIAKEVGMTDTNNKGVAAFRSELLSEITKVIPMIQAAAQKPIV